MAVDFPGEINNHGNLFITRNNPNVNASEGSVSRTLIKIPKPYNVPPARLDNSCDPMEEYFMLKYKSKQRLQELGGPCGVASAGRVIYRGA